MSDPKRLLEDDGTSPQVAELLRSARAPRSMTRGEMQWAHRRVTRMAAAPLAVGLLIWVKKLALAAIFGGAVGGVVIAVAPVLRRQPPPSSVPAVSAPQPVRAPLPVDPAASSELEADADVAAEPSARPSPAPSEPPQSDSIAEEAALLEHARSLLASDPASALQLLQSHERAFRHPKLVTDREFLTVDALRRLAKMPQARALADKMIEQQPDGLYAERLRAMFGTASTADSGLGGQAGSVAPSSGAR